MPKGVANGGQGGAVATPPPLPDPGAPLVLLGFVQKYILAPKFFFVLSVSLTVKGELESPEGYRCTDLHVALLHHDVGSVAELNQLLHGLLVHVADGDLCGARLRQLARKHRAEVRAAC